MKSYHTSMDPKYLGKAKLIIKATTAIRKVKTEKPNNTTKTKFRQFMSNPETFSKISSDPQHIQDC